MAPVFKDAPIARELQRYVGRESMSGFRYRFDKSIPTVKSYSSRVSEGDAQAVLGDLLRRVAEAPETAARFEKAIALQPVSARALALYGLLRLDEDEPEKALPLLMAAAKDKTDWLVQYHVATGLTRVITTTDDPDPAVIATAREALSIAQAARPDLANGYALAARLDTAEGTNSTQALQSIRRARTGSPGREDYILLEAFIRMRLGEYVAARQLLTPLTAARNTASIRANAQEVLEQVDCSNARPRSSWRGWKDRTSRPLARPASVAEPRSIENSSPANLASRDSSNGSPARPRKS